MKHSKATSKAEPGSGIDGIARNDFVDEAEGDVKVRSFTSGRGRVSGGSVSEGSVSEGNASKGKSKGNFSKGNRARQLEPETICDAGGRLGWRVKLPGALPLATPAGANGKEILGGGF